MAWTAGVDVTTGDLITAAQWNNYLGTSGSLNYLEGALDDCSPSAPSRALDTIYQNGDKIRIVLVTATLDNGEAIKALIGSGTPPTTITGRAKCIFVDADYIDFPLTFVVPPSYYYEVETTGTPTKLYWYEWDILQ